MDAIKLIISDISQPSDYHDNWYMWSSNQMAHITLGIFLTAIFSYLNFLIIGEFAHKGVLWAMVAFAFAIQQGKSWAIKTRDTLEDFCFVVVYGAGTSIVMFTEVEPGSPDMVTSISNIAPICAIVITHLFVGSIVRALRQVNNGT